jgi:hypothetical protein
MKPMTADCNWKKRKAIYADYLRLRCKQPWMDDLETKVG